MSTATTSSSINGLSSPGMAAPTVLQTGASKMAAAAKRGQAGLDSGPRRSTSEEEEHPLSEKSLKARCVPVEPFLDRNALP